MRERKNAVILLTSMNGDVFQLNTVEQDAADPTVDVRPLPVKTLNIGVTNKRKQMQDASSNLR